MSSLQPFILRSGEGDAVWSLGGRFTSKFAQTDGPFSLIEVVATQATEPPRHIHNREDEAFYILDGQLTFHVADQVLEAPTGSFVFAPRGLPHAFTVDIEPSRVLLFASPSGFEMFARELGVPASGAQPPPGLEMPGPDVLGPVAERFGIDIVGPPVRVLS